MKVATSFNGGLTWDVISEVQQRTTDKDDNDAANVLQLPNGRVLFVFQNHSKDENTGAWTRYRITLCYSADYGYTWDHLQQVYQRAANNDGLWEPFLKHLPNGELHCYFSEETSLVDQNIVIWRSFNEGQDWQFLGTVIGFNEGYTIDGSPGVATISGTKVIMVFEEKRGDDANARFSLHYAISNNEGGTYTTRRPLYEPPAGRGAAFPQIVNVDGVLVVSYLSDVNKPNLNSEDGADFFVRTSTDDGFTWSDPTLIGTGAHRPGLLALDSTTFLALWTSDDLAGSLVTQQWKIT